MKTSVEQAAAGRSRRRISRPEFESIGCTMPGSGCIDTREDMKQFLLQAVACAFEVDESHLLTPTRGFAPIARARQVLMYLAHVACGLTMTDVGRLFRRDRTTVAHACNVVEECREDIAFDRALELLECSVVLVQGAPRNGRSA